MIDQIDKHVASLLTGFLVTYLLTPCVRSLAIGYNVVDLPNARRPHKRPTARGGGIAVVCGVHAAYLVAYLFPGSNQTQTLGLHWWFWYAGATALLTIVGLIDDTCGLRPSVKLGGQTLAALIMS